MRILSIFATSAAATALASFAAPASAQDVRYLPQGEMEVHFPGPCIVFYSNRGVRTHADPRCSSYQRNAADQRVAQLGYNGGYRPPIGGGYRPPIGGGGKYQISDIRFDRVRFIDGCVVKYNNYGNRIDSSNRCDSGQKRFADNAIRDWRIRQGYGQGNGPGYGPGNGVGPWGMTIIPELAGALKVHFRDGCDVRYNGYGVRYRSDDHCSRDQKMRADDAVRQYRSGGRY